VLYKSIYLARRNPSIAPEDWPRAWRSHPRAVAQLGSVGAAIGGAIDTIDYCARVREPVLDGARFDPPGVSREHDGVAVVSSASEDLHRIGSNREGQEAVIQDEVRVFGRPADQFSLACREVASLGGRPGQAAVIRFLVRKAGVTPDEFMARWTGRHADLVRAAVEDGKIGRYVQNAIVREPPAGYAFDGISETWFHDVEESVRSFVDPVLTALCDDLIHFCDVVRSVTMLTEVIYRVPRE
jgi:hypothetical protein